MTVSFKKWVPFAVFPRQPQHCLPSYLGFYQQQTAEKARPFPELFQPLRGFIGARPRCSIMFSVNYCMKVCVAVKVSEEDLEILASNLYPVIASHWVTLGQLHILCLTVTGLLWGECHKLLGSHCGAKWSMHEVKKCIWSCKEIKRRGLVGELGGEKQRNVSVWGWCGDTQES